MSYVNENGSRDYRLLPPALALWLVAALRLSHILSLKFGLFIALSFLLIPVALEIIRTRYSYRTPFTAWFTHMLSSQLAVTALALVIMLISCEVLLMNQRSDPLIQLVASFSQQASHHTVQQTAHNSWRYSAQFATQRKKASTAREPVRITFELTTPALATAKKGFDCYADARALSLQRAQIVTASSARIRIFATGALCQAGVAQVWSMPAKLSLPQYGNQDAWAMKKEAKTSASTAQGSENSSASSSTGSFAGSATQPLSYRVRAAPAFRTLIASLHTAFLRQTRKLPPTQAILVPGVTMGISGADVLSSRHADLHEREEELSQWFREAGIIHLLAVSGGHLALIREWAKRRLACSRLWASMKVMISLALVLACASLLFPSDSLLRAVVMACFTSVALLRGRPAQSLSALCWSVMGVLICAPYLALSVGFAFSCAAVGGIILLAHHWAQLMSKTWLLRALGFSAKSREKLSESLALTMSAQVAILPVQMLMLGQMGSSMLVAVLANFLVTPVVSVATIAGLLSLLTSWLLPWLGFAFAAVSGVCCEVMAWVAHFAVSLPH
ncbi:MAG TPA: ComEC/Rec2 family competence protein [Aeriscardovia aeriphila]|uniref:ComEC/Rec2 family competence protein n=1 Tax=Aeriscardovia aeriphila TaxID=218139 RepID=A0A921KBQ1_9BIFI|nr:ComEC/Rec2 family competence protein [Aeriscardovia aeriphila]